MTKEEYVDKVRSTAVAILTECDAREWKRENEDKEFWAFEEDKNYDGQIHSILDATCGIGGWEEAIDIIQATDQNPDNVDSGIYEGCNWKRILVCIAYEVFQWDVMESAQEMFDEGVFEESVLAYPDTPHQKGFFPKTKKFKIPGGPWVVNMGDGVKILENGKLAGNREASLSVVFEGKVTAMGAQNIRYIVDCRRVYNQTDTDIEDDLVRVKEEYDVREC